MDLEADGVRVHLADGSTISGSVVIGADGVHSGSRKALQKLANATRGGGAFDDPMVSSFYGLFGQASTAGLDIEHEVFFESRGAGVVIQCLAGRGRLQFVVLKPLPEPMTGRKRYSEDDMEKYAALIADVAVCPGIRFRDVWARADKASVRMLNQEEGLLRQWHHGRLALVGDAVHKSTSVNGLGMTCGVHSAAVLANELQRLVTATPNPSLEMVEQAFGRYQRSRQAEVKTIWSGGRAMIREVTRISWASWFWDEYVLPWVDIESLARGILVSLLLIRYGQMLSYIPFAGRFGRVAWVNQPASA